ncbi:Uncharacterized protein family UPF0052 [Musa troglodytarum]|uniref:Uncharacterized protein family UPF0052 n=1 Tax=Musa troglodytarum TaxID=320322 RepID=A0A9E7FEB2_9LILI|nr:Uncharacterized protein family UPF0052 [Musa troglodytarum]
MVAGGLLGGPAPSRTPFLRSSSPRPPLPSPSSFPSVAARSIPRPSVVPMAASHCSSGTSPRGADASSPSSSPNLVDPPSLLVFSGGTAFNGVVEELKKLTTRVAHVLPVSDDGGSTAEIVRVLGGPAVGDIRSRCLRLSDESTSEALAVRKLLGHRLSLDAAEAKSEWTYFQMISTRLSKESIVYGMVYHDHMVKQFVHFWLFSNIRYFNALMNLSVSAMAGAALNANKILFLSFVILMSALEISFCWSRIFFQSLEAAVFCCLRVSDIPTESLVLPVISTNDRLTLGCELWVFSC